MDNNLSDISSVCKRLGISSRTLRFYEEKGLIKSIRNSDTTRRLYDTNEQGKIRNILALRSIGLSLDEIRDLLKEDSDLRSAIIDKRAKIKAHIYEQQKILLLLNEALQSVKDVGNLEGLAAKGISLSQESDLTYISDICSKAFISGDIDTLYRYTSDTVSEYMPKDAFRDHIRPDSLEPVGAFCKLNPPFTDSDYPNIVYQRIDYSKLGIELKYVFSNEKINGLWMNYYEV